MHGIILPKTLFILANIRKVIKHDNGTISNRIVNRALLAWGACIHIFVFGPTNFV